VVRQGDDEAIDPRERDLLAADILVPDSFLDRLHADGEPLLRSPHESAEQPFTDRGSPR
jgi:hypothetical protein